jgi:valyl-tRNA synthetase
MLSEWPEFDASLINEEVEGKVNLLCNVIRSIRNLRAEMNVPASKEAEVIILLSDSVKLNLLSENEIYIKKLAKVGKLNLVNILPEPPKESASAYVEGLQIYLLLHGLIDFEKERIRLEKQIVDIDREIVNLNKKLSDEKFISHAPAEVVDKEKQKHIALHEKKEVCLERLKVLQIS